MSKHIKTKKSKVKTQCGFLLHVKIERLVLQEQTRLDSLRGIDGRHEHTSTRSKSTDMYFIENIGAVSIFSMAEAEKLYTNSKEIYGDDRDRYARNLLSELAENGNRKNLAGAPDLESINTLRESYPNFSEAIDQIEYAAALSKLSDHAWFQMTPLMLLGPPGVGKTAFAQAFAKILGTYYKRIDVGTLSTASTLAGQSLGWGNGHTGEMFRIMNESETANPLIMLDEVDKISGHHSAPIEPTLLALLEKESAANFADEALQLQINCKHILWIATANEINSISAPLRSRFNIVNVRTPTQDEAPKIINSIYRKIKKDNPWGHRFEDMLDESVIESLTYVNPRKISTLLQTGFGHAAKRSSTKIECIDILLKHSPKKSTIGFIQ